MGLSHGEFFNIDINIKKIQICNSNSVIQLLCLYFTGMRCNRVPVIMSLLKFKSKEKVISKK